MATATAPPLTLATVDAGRLYDVRAVGEALGFSPVVVERQCRQGRIAARKVLGRWRVLGAEILRLYGAAVLAAQVPTGPTERELAKRISDYQKRLTRRAK